MMIRLHKAVITVQSLGIADGFLLSTRVRVEHGVQASVRATAQRRRRDGERDRPPGEGAAHQVRCLCWAVDAVSALILYENTGKLTACGSPLECSDLC